MSPPSTTPPPSRAGKKQPPGCQHHHPPLVRFPSLSSQPDAGSQGRASGIQLGPKSLNIPILQVGKEGKQVQKRGYVPGHFTMK